jgi:hypothetical protein
MYWVQSHAMHLSAEEIPGWVLHDYRLSASDIVEWTRTIMAHPDVQIRNSRF